MTIALLQEHRPNHLDILIYVNKQLIFTPAFEARKKLFGGLAWTGVP